MTSPRYDYIFLGAGAAALSLVMRMRHSGLLNQQKVLLVDRHLEPRNDRTWCYWEQHAGFFDPVVHHRWPSLLFRAPGYELPLDIAPFEYKMIRGIDFYEYCFAAIKNCPQVESLVGEITFRETEQGRTEVAVNGIPLHNNGAVVFNSLHTPGPVTNDNLALLQHFTGWVIEAGEACFDPRQATLMDFRVSQKEGTTFAYVLPLTATRALIEYTLFTKKLLSTQEYEEALRNYLHTQLQVKDYRIVEKEFGVIPMSDRRYPFKYQGMYHIGTAGGQTKGSTGYTFQFIQKQSEWIIQRLQNGLPLPDRFPAPGRFHFYDAVLLNLLVKGDPPGREIFTRLFRKNRAHRVFKFLDNETNLAEELRLISSLQFFPFLKAALRMWRN